MKNRFRIMALAIFVMAVLAGCGKTKIDVTEQLTATFSGYNGYGNVEIENGYAWEDAAFEVIGIDEINDFNSLLSAAMVESAVQYEITPNSNLSNGDKVTVRAVIDEAFFEEYDLIMASETKEFVVEGLEEIKIVDPFDGISVSYTGIAPNGKASLMDDNTDAYLGISRYDIEPKEGLSNGDTVKVKLYPDNAAEKATEYGYTFAETEKEFVVEGLPAFVTELSEIPEDLFEQMKQQSEDVIVAHTARWTADNVLTSIEFLGNYFFYTKDASLYDDMSYCYNVYKINVSSDGEPFSFYYYVRFCNLMIDENEQGIVDLMNTVTPNGVVLTRTLISGEAFSHGKYAFNGYEDLAAMYNYCATKYIEHYTVESNVQ